MPGTFDLILATGPAALVFAAIFVAGQRFHPLRSFVRDRRDVVSFSAGMSAAYVFVHMMPALAEAREVIVESASGLAVEAGGEAAGEGGRAMHLGGSCLVGWTLGVLLALPPFTLALVMAFISGGEIVTNALMELSEGKDGRFVAFMSGSLAYGLMLVPLG